MNDLKPLLVELQGAQKFQRVLAGPPYTAGMKSGHVILRTGESVGEHRTEGREEALVILDGRAEVFVAGKPLFSAEKGTVVYIPPQTDHDIKNSGEAPLRYVYVVTPVPA